MCIDAHLEEVAEGNFRLFVGMVADVSLDGGNDGVGFCLDDLSIVSPAEERRLVNPSRAARSIGCNAAIFTSLPHKRVGIELEIA